MRNFRLFLNFFKDLISSRKLIFELAKKDLQVRYLGSYLGILWAFIFPMVNILVLWFVFQVGFKNAPIGNIPFILWLMCGIIPWYFFSDSLMGGTNSIMDNAYLVKKVVFRVSILPIIRVISALFIHMFFIAVLFFMFFIYGYKPSIYNIQIIYYLFATIVLVLGFTWLTSAIVIFLKDIGQIINVILQIGFWITPIFWSINTLPPKFLFIIKLNPMNYIVQGYRESMIDHVWFWDHYNLTLNFWLITIPLLVIGVFVFRKLRPHFADVL